MKLNTKKPKSSELELKEKTVAINRVVKTTKGGRTFSFSAIVVVGNGKGVVGYGLGKAKEVQKAVAKGIDDAKKNLIKVSLQKDTIPHEVFVNFGASKVMIKPASHGTGVIAGGSMRSVLESAGIKDVLAKNLGSSNPQNVVKATVKALSLLRSPYEVAQERGVELKKLFE